jgi:hypothetical protein
MRKSAKRPSNKFEQEMEAERRAMKDRPYRMTDEMITSQAEYRKLLADRKAGQAPLYTTADGRRYE